MQIDRIRAQIEEGKAVERQTGTLHRAVINLTRQNSWSLPESDVGKIVDFVTDYIEYAPALMAAIEEDASANGTLSDVQPILDAAEDYFLAPDDVIPDHYGLVGLLDDAYLAHALIEVVSERCESQAGQPLLSAEAHDVNAFIRRLMGEPFIGILDEYLSTTVASLDRQENTHRMLIALAKTNLSAVPGPTLLIDLEAHFIVRLRE